MTLHRVISAILGLLSAFAGFVAFGYATMAISELARIDGPLWLGLVGVVLIGALTAGAFYMSFRLLRFALFARRSNRSS